MFTYTFTCFQQDLTNFQKIIFFFLKKLFKFIDIPLFSHFPLFNFSLNFKLIVEMALNYNVPQKFIDFSLDASEMYYNEYNSNSELIYLFFILFKTKKEYKLIVLVCILFLFIKT